jgi:hypothetical protein
MFVHLLTDDIKKYLNRRMTPAELLAADDHLAVCDECIQQVRASPYFPAGATDLDFLRPASGETGHLSYEQLTGYADETADSVEREIAELHLTVCRDCQEDLKGIGEMKNLIAADLQKQQTSEPPNQTALTDQFRTFLTGRPFPRFGFAGLALLMVFAVCGTYWILTRETSDELADVPPSENNSTPLPSPANLPARPVNKQPPDGRNENSPDEESVPARVTTPERKDDQLPASYPPQIQRVLAGGKLNIPADVRKLGDRTGRLMSGGTDDIPFALSKPVGRVIRTARPQFRWQALPGADGYTVRVFDENFREVAVSPPVTTTNWQIRKALPRGTTYRWQVTAAKDGEEISSPVRPAPDARFKILDAKTADRLSQAESKYPDAHLTLGILYAEAGLLDEAEQKIRKELRRDPRSKTARRLLRDLRRQK